jgi:hypothetical protein
MCAGVEAMLGKSLGFVAVGMLLVACAAEEEPRNGVDVAPASACKGADCAEDAPGKEPTKTARGQAPAPAAGDPSAPAPPPIETPSPSTENTCQTAVDLGSMAGEPVLFSSNIETFATQGRCTTWVKIRVNETSSFPNPMQLEASLISPSSHKFDLLAYVNVAKDEVECATPTKVSASTTSNVDKVSLLWSDGWGDDSRTVTVQVKSRDGKCDSANAWVLTVNTATVSLIPGQ